MHHILSLSVIHKHKQTFPLSLLFCSLRQWLIYEKRGKRGIERKTEYEKRNSEKEYAGPTTTSISIFLWADCSEATQRAIKIPQVSILATCLAVQYEHTICSKMGFGAILSPMAFKFTAEQREWTAGCLSVAGWCRVNLFNHMPSLFTSAYLRICFTYSECTQQRA